MASSPKVPPPTGWLVFCGELVPDMTLAGHVRRREQPRFACRTMRWCKRNSTPDLEMLVARGFGGLSIADLRDLLACRAPGGCSLEVVPDLQEGLSVFQLARVEGCAVRFTCSKCGAAKDTSPAMVDARHRQGKPREAPSLRVRELADLALIPCKACGASQWRVEVRWPMVRETFAHTP